VTQLSRRVTMDAPLTMVINEDLLRAGRRGGGHTMGFTMNRIGSIKALGIWLSILTVSLLLAPSASNLAFSADRARGVYFTGDIATELAGGQSVHEHKTDVSTRNGIAIWSTAVRFFRSEGAGRKVSLDTWGPRRVLNFLSVRPDGMPSHIATRNRTERAGDRNSYLSTPDIEVKVQQGFVTLGGTMDTQLENFRIGDLAGMVRGVLNILKGLTMTCPARRK